MQPAMWIEALRTIPRPTPDDWRRYDLFTRWLIATRAAVLVMTAVAAGIGGLVAWRDGLFDGPRFALCMIGLLLAHATNNLVNDLTDSITGVDKGNYFRTQYGTQPIEHGLMTRAGLARYAIFTGLPALAIGLWFVATGGEGILWLLASGIVFVLFYTWPLKHIGLGEPAVIAVWGPLMTGGTYLAVTGAWSADAAWLSLPFALGATTVLFGKHIDKLEADAAKGVRTLPVLLGERAARATALVLVAGQYGLCGWLWLDGRIGPAVALVLLAAPLLRHVWTAFRAPRPAAPPPEFPASAWPLWFVAFAFVHNRRFGGLYLLALGLDAWLRRGG